MANQNFRVKTGLEVGTAVTISGGIVTATSFVGSGSQLTNISSNYANISGVSSSVVGGAVSATSLRVTGISTFDGAIQVRNGYNLNIGDNNDLRIYNDGTDSRIEETGLGSLYISGSDINIQQHSTNKNFARFVGPAAELYYDNIKKLSTSGIGVTITGTLVADQINVSGVVTASSFSGNASSATYATTAGIATYSASAGIATYATTAGIATYSASAGIATYATTAGIATYAISSGISTSVIGGISSISQLQVTGISTFVNGPILVGSGTSTGTSAQRLQVTGGAYVSGNLGIGTTNPTEPGISVLGKVLIQQNSNSENRLIFRGQPGSSYRWNIDNYSSSNDFRIFREDDATSANGSVAVSISTTGNLNDGKGNVRAIPQNSQTSAYILAASDIGKHISITTGGVTINTGIFSAGDAVSIYNNSGSNQTITQGTSVTLRQAGTANTGNRTLAQYGVCTVLCVGSGTFVISGAGLS